MHWPMCTITLHTQIILCTHILYIDQCTQLHYTLHIVHWLVYTHILLTYIDLYTHIHSTHRAIFARMGCIGVPWIHGQAVPFMSISMQWLHRHCWLQFDSCVDVCPRMHTVWVWGHVLVQLSNRTSSYVCAAAASQQTWIGLSAHGRPEHQCIPCRQKWSFVIM